MIFSQIDLKTWVKILKEVSEGAFVRGVEKTQEDLRKLLGLNS